MFDLRAIVAVLVGGALGSCARYALGVLAVARFGDGWPVATFTVNIVGSFAIGVVAELAAARALGVSPLVRTFIATGILGGFTTFSSFSLDIVALSTNRSPVAALAYALLSVVGGVAAAFVGFVCARSAFVQP